jgi:polyisoprenoid-binding protein YceI
LIGAKYLNSRSFPNATFVSQKVHRDARGKYVLTGIFKLHGVQKAIDLVLENPTISTFKTGRKTLAASATVAIDQTNYGLSFRLLHPDGFVRINNKIAVNVSIEAIEDTSRK